MFSQQLKKSLARGLVIISLFTGTFTFNAMGQRSSAEAAMAQTKSSVNFRYGPSTNYSIIRKLSGGTAIDVISHQTYWSKVREGQSVGYISNRYINFTSSGLITGRVNLRDGEGMDSNILIKIPAGQTVQVLAGPVNGWYKVVWNNLTGHIHRNYVEVSGSGAAIVEDLPEDPSGGEAAAPSSGYITSRVNLRDRGGMDSNILIKIPAGQTVQVVSGPASGWYNIIWNSLNGYVYKNYIDVSGNAPSEPAPPEQTVGETEGTYKLDKETRTYVTSSDARSQVNSVGTYPAGTYFLYKTYDEMVNVSRTEGKPGAWINPAATEAPAPSPAPAPEPAPAPGDEDPYPGYTKMTWTFTFYTDLPSENGGWTTTALGTPLRYGVLSSNYWPLRSQVILPGWGEFTVEDRGGSAFDSKTRMDMLIPRNTGESDYQYQSRIRAMGVQSITGYIKPYKK